MGLAVRERKSEPAESPGKREASEFRWLPACLGTGVGGYEQVMEGPGRRVEGWLAMSQNATPPPRPCEVALQQEQLQEAEHILCLSFNCG